VRRQLRERFRGGGSRARSDIRMCLRWGDWKEARAVRCRRVRGRAFVRRRGLNGGQRVSGLLQGCLWPCIRGNLLMCKNDRYGTAAISGRDSRETWTPGASRLDMHGGAQREN